VKRNFVLIHAKKEEFCMILIVRFYLNAEHVSEFQRFLADEKSGLEMLAI